MWCFAASSAISRGLFRRDGERLLDHHGNAPLGAGADDFQVIVGRGEGGDGVGLRGIEHRGHGGIGGTGWKSFGSK